MSTAPEEFRFATTAGDRVSWAEWYLDTLDALVATIEGASVEWATDSEGEPWVIASDRLSSIPAMPCAIIPSFEMTRDDGESSPSHEYRTIEASVALVTSGDPKDQRGNLRAAIRLAGGVEDALYANRSLSRTAERVWVSRMVPFDSPTDSAAVAGAGLTVKITKKAVFDD